MQETGWGKARVRRALRLARKRDHSFAKGEILGSMCTLPHPLAAAADRAFLETNLGDPDHFPGTRDLETEVLEDLRILLHGPARAAGRFLTGGTEANLLACALAREKTDKRTIVAPQHAHFSFEKAAKLLDMRLKWVPTGTDGRADPAAMAKAMGRDTALIVGVAGTTELGLVDDIPALARLATAKKALLHVDAAFGGYVIPFLPKPKRFDLGVRGVWSVSMDPHKMGLATIPGGVLVLRDGTDWDHLAVETPYVSTARQAQLLGTRPGAAAAAAWAAHRALGRDGYRDIVSSCMEVARHLAHGLRSRGIPLVAEPELNVVTFHADDPPALAAALETRRLRVNIVPRLSGIRIVVGPHVDRKAADRLLAALDEVV